MPNKISKEQWIKEFIQWSLRHTQWDEETAEEVASENLDKWANGTPADQAASELKINCGA